MKDWIGNKVAVSACYLVEDSLSYGCWVTENRCYHATLHDVTPHGVLVDESFIPWNMIYSIDIIRGGETPPGDEL